MNNAVTEEQLSKFAPPCTPKRFKVLTACVVESTSCLLTFTGSEKTDQFLSCKETDEDGFYLHNVTTGLT